LSVIRQLKDCSLSDLSDGGYYPMSEQFD
jgi:hypothetical protein